MSICGFDMSFSAEGLHGVYAVMACFMWLVSLLFSREYMAGYGGKGRYYGFMLATFAATVGVFLSADLLTTFVFFEMMSLASYVLVIHDGSRAAMRAGSTYLAVAVGGGMCILMGLFLLFDLTGTLSISELPAACGPYAGTGRLYAAAVLMLIGFGAKAGLFPLHIWLPKAHPVAPAPASALLSGILTKTGIYGMIVVSCRMLCGDALWAAVMLFAGAVTMLLGALLALFSRDLKRTLACSSVSQIGFISVGIGMVCITAGESHMAGPGTALHMVNHSLIKLLLFSCAGAVYMNLHRLALKDVRGWGRNKPFLALCFAAGVLAISGVPGTSGYISKTLLHESIVEYMEELSHAGGDVAPFALLERAFLISGGLTFAYMTRLFFCLFVDKNSTESLQMSYNKKIPGYIGRLSAFAVALPAAALALLSAAYTDGHYYTWTNLKGSLASLAIGCAIVLLLRGKELPRAGFDLEDSVYRPFISKVAVPMLYGAARILSASFDAVSGALIKALAGASGVCCASFDAVSGALIKALAGANGVLCSSFERLAEGAVALLSEGTAAICDAADSFTAFLGEGPLRPIKPHEERFSPMERLRGHSVSRRWREARLDILDFANSMSFGLLTALLGLGIFLLYLVRH